MIFRFARETITVEDKEVEFVTKLCGGGGGGPVAPPPDSALELELAPGAQRGGGGGGTGGGRGTAPACNYNVKKTFKLKDMVVKGELSL